ASCIILQALETLVELVGRVSRFETLLHNRRLWHSILAIADGQTSSESSRLKRLRTRTSGPTSATGGSVANCVGEAFHVAPFPGFACLRRFGCRDSRRDYALVEHKPAAQPV